MRVVIDTNVVVSRFLSSTGPPAELFARWQEDEFALLVSPPILAEYERVLNYRHVAVHHKMTTEEVAAVVQDFRQFAVLIEPDEILEVVKEDPADNRFLECAAAGEGEYIISGDIHLLRLGEYQGIQVLTPTAFLAVLNQEKGQT